MSSFLRPLIWIQAFLAAFLAYNSSPAQVNDPEINSRQQFTKALKQRTEIIEISNRIAQLVAGGNYDEAETTLHDLLSQKLLSNDGQRQLEKVYFQLSAMQQLKVWNRWCDARPASHFPFTVRGMYFLERARFLDGANQTLLLSKRQRQDFNLFLRSAQADLEKAVGLYAGDPGPPAALTALSLHLKAPRSDMEKWFSRAVDIDPRWLSAYRAKLLYLSPRWYGSDQMMAQFAQQSFENEGTDSNTYIVALDYLKLKSNRLGKGLQGDRFLLAPDVYKMVITGVDRYVQDYPFSKRINTYQSLKEQAISEPYVAIAAFTETLNSDPGNLESRKGRISSYFKNRQFREAKADLVYLEQLQGETPFSRLGLGIIAFKSGQDFGQAHQLFETAIALEESSWRRKHYYYQRAELYRQMGRYREAITDYSAALEEDILFEDAYFGRAQSRHAQNDLEGALADLVIIKSTIKGRLTTKARSLINSYLKTPSKPADYSQVPASSYPRLQTSKNLSQTKTETQSDSDNGHREFLVRGLRYFYEDDFEAARKDFYRVISQDPDNSKAYFMLGTIVAQHDFNRLQACVFFRESYRLAPDTPDYMLEMSRCLFREHRFSDTIELLSRFIDSDRPSPVDDLTLAQIFFLRGLCLEETGLMSEAFTDMQQAYELDSGLKAAALFIRDQRPKAYPEAGPDQQVASPTAISLATAKTTEVAELNETGRQHLLEGDVTGAKVSFLKAIRLNPEASGAYHQLGRLYFEQEQNYDKARIYYSQAIERDSQVSHYYFDRAAIHFFFKQYDLAREDYTRVLELQPLDSRSLYYRGVCNHYLGNVEAAQRDFQRLRQSDKVWNVEIERFRNAWKAEINDFLEASP